MIPRPVERSAKTRPVRQSISVSVTRLNPLDAQRRPTSEANRLRESGRVSCRVACVGRTGHFDSVPQFGSPKSAGEILVGKVEPDREEPTGGGS